MDPYYHMLQFCKFLQNVHHESGYVISFFPPQAEWHMFYENVVYLPCTKCSYIKDVKMHSK